MGSFSIVICAHNEEKNISSILSDILGQLIPTDYSLTNIIVVADGCTDGTVACATAVLQGQDKHFLLIETPRMGKILAFNEAVKFVTDDYLILFDADVRLKDDRVIERFLVRAGMGYELVSGNDQPTTNTMSPGLMKWTAIGRDRFKQLMKRKYPVYSCVGRGMLLGRKLYKDFQLPNFPGQDNLHYFESVRRQIGFSYLSEAIIYFAPPSCCRDAIAQQVRFWEAMYSAKALYGSLAKYGSAGEILRTVAHLFYRHPRFTCVWSVFSGVSFCCFIWKRFLLRQRPTGLWMHLESTKSVTT